MHQIKVNREKNSALLDLNPFFYPLKTVKETAVAFKALCSTKFREEGGRLLVEIKAKPKQDCEETTLNFLNYALAVRKEMR